MNFYQADNLIAVIARLHELSGEHQAYKFTLACLCATGEQALITHTEDAYNKFMTQCGALLSDIRVEL